VGVGEAEPFLVISFGDGEADTEAHVMESTSLYPPPCISLIETLLTGTVLLLVFFNIKVCRENARVLSINDQFAKQGDELNELLEGMEKFIKFPHIKVVKCLNCCQVYMENLFRWMDFYRTKLYEHFRQQAFPNEIDDDDVLENYFGIAQAGYFTEEDDANVNALLAIF